MPSSDEIKRRLGEHFGERIELDTPFSRLKDAPITLEDDRPFFAMGLKSNAVNSLSAELGRAFGVHLDVTQLFETPTQRSLRAYLSELCSSPDESTQSTLTTIFK